MFERVAGKSLQGTCMSGCSNVCSVHGFDARMQPHFRKADDMSTAMISQRSTTVRPTRAVAPAAARRSKLHLTRRGRVVFTVLAAIPLMLVVALLVLNGGQASAGDAAGSGYRTSFETVTIEPGQTLWQVAEQQAPNTDPREFVQDVVTLNNLDGSAVQAGQQIAIPLDYSK
jgi:hypothetical protein